MVVALELLTPEGLVGKAHISHNPRRVYAPLGGLLEAPEGVSGAVLWKLQTLYLDLHPVFLAHQHTVHRLGIYIMT